MRINNKPFTFEEFGQWAITHNCGLHSPEAVAEFVHLLEEEIGERASPELLASFASKLEAAADCMRGIARERL